MTRSETSPALKVFHQIGMAAAFLFLTLLFSWTPRTDFHSLLVIYAAMFGLYLAWMLPAWKQSRSQFKVLIGIAITARILLLFGEPTLSDDYFRFLWDGRLLLHGFNPFDHTPRQLMESGMVYGAQWEALYQNMNSRDYFSLYPPVNQVVFYIANVLSPDHIYPAVLVVKLFVLVAEIIAMISLYQICSALGQNTWNVLWYALNPLVIIEFCGNLHFEGIMITFLLLCCWMLISGRVIPGALAFTGAVLTKVHPLMLLPFILKYLGWQKGARFAAVAGVLITIGFGAFLFPSDMVAVRLSNMMESFRLYFENFEFNAGIYYILRWIGFQSYGYNPIDKVGKLLFAVNILILAWLFFRMKRTNASLIGMFFLAYLVYELLATTVHPWYILPILPFAILSGFRTATVWTALVFLSYFTYSQPGWHENFSLLTLEYTCIFAFLFYEFTDGQKLNKIL